MKVSTCVHCGERIAFREPDPGETVFAMEGDLTPRWLDDSRCWSDCCPIDENGRAADGSRCPVHQPSLVVDRIIAGDREVPRLVTLNPAIDRLVGSLVVLAIAAIFLWFLIQATR